MILHGHISITECYKTTSCFEKKTADLLNIKQARKYLKFALSNKI